MFAISKQWVTDQLEALKAWVRQYVKDAIDNDRMARAEVLHKQAERERLTLTDLVDQTRAAVNSALGLPASAALGNAEPAKFKCGCKACWDYEHDPIAQAFRSIRSYSWLYGERKANTEGMPSANCIHKRVNLIEQKVDLLLAHLKLEVKNVDAVEAKQVLASTAKPAKKRRRS